MCERIDPSWDDVRTLTDCARAGKFSLIQAILEKQNISRLDEEIQSKKELITETKEDIKILKRMRKLFIRR